MRVALYKATRPGIQGAYSHVTRWVDGGIYSHAELVFSDGMSASASFIDGGVRFKQIDYNPAHWDFIDVPGDEQQARQWFIDHEGERYDIKGNLKFGLWVIPESQDRWFCSEAIAAALGMPEPWRYGPNGLACALTFLLTYCKTPLASA